MRKYKLSSKLIVSFLLIGMTVILGGILGFAGISSMGDCLKEVSDIQIPAAVSLGQLIVSQKNIYKIQQSLLIPEILEDDDATSQLIQQLDQASQEAEMNWKKLESLPRSEEGDKMWSNLKPAWESWKKDHNLIVQGVLAGKIDKALTKESSNGSFLQARDLLQRLFKLNTDSSEKSSTQVKAIAFRQKCIIVAGAICGFILVLLFTLYSSRSIVHPIRHIIGSLSEAYSRFNSASEQIASASYQFTEGASTQAAAVEEVSSVTAELSSNIQENKQDVEKLSGISADTNKVGMATFELFRQAKKATKEIKLSCEQVSKIVKTIGEIAFQTNLLALSASIEAAQSHEASSGFSVVAKEVKNLASRSSEAAKNTALLIEENSKLIKKGDDLVRASLGSFISYGEVSSPISSFSETAAEAAQKQAYGIEQINNALEEISQTAQRTAANAQESTAATQEINNQATSMAGVVKELMTIL